MIATTRTSHRRSLVGCDCPLSAFHLVAVIGRRLIVCFGDRMLAAAGEREGMKLVPLKIIFNPKNRAKVEFQGEGVMAP